MLGVRFSTPVETLAAAAAARPHGEHVRASDAQPSTSWDLWLSVTADGPSRAEKLLDEQAGLGRGAQD